MLGGKKVSGICLRLEFIATLFEVSRNLGKLAMDLLKMPVCLLRVIGLLSEVIVESQATKICSYYTSVQE